MPTAIIESTKSFALTRVDILVGRVFSVASLLSFIEVVANALRFSSLVSSPLEIIALALLAFVQVANLISYLASSTTLIWYRGQAIVALATLALWPLLSNDIFTTETKPWIWWALGTAAIAASRGFKPAIAALFLVAYPIIWFFLRTSDSGGGASWQSTLQDAIYTFLFSAAMSTLVVLFRNAARNVDLENQRATLASAERARVDAVERERARIDALVHDKVLTALLVASKGKTEEEAQAAALMASEAIVALSDSVSAFETEAQKASINSLFMALTEAIKRLSSEINVQAEGASDQPVPSDVAFALTEATIQAVNNSLLHAGTAATRGVRLKANERVIKIVIFDTGRGFRPARVPKNRLGLRLSIIDRIENVGGRVFIDSKPGSGTNIILEWDIK
jgi:signal transduction histidine kinase